MSRVQKQVDSRSRKPVHRLGPQRNPDIDTSVLTATRELLAERGYQDTTIDAIAGRAGVGRPSIYRRWRTKAHIVHDAIYPSIDPLPSTGEPVEDRIEQLIAGSYALFGSRPARAGVPGLISDTRADTELHERLVDEQLGPIRTAVSQLVDEGIADGTIRATVDADTIVDALAGAAIFAMSVRDADDGAALAARLTDLLLHGMVNRGSRRDDAADE